MYSPKIYNAQIPSLYHAAQATNVPMTKLVNAFVYEGLATGYYGLNATNNLPSLENALPWMSKPALQLVQEDAPSNGFNQSKPLMPNEIERLHAWYDSLQVVAEKYDRGRE